jgi:hypothetical protein
MLCVAAISSYNVFRFFLPDSVTRKTFSPSAVMFKPKKKHFKGTESRFKSSKKPRRDPSPVRDFYGGEEYSSNSILLSTDNRRVTSTVTPVEVLPELVPRTQEPEIQWPSWQYAEDCGEDPHPVYVSQPKVHPVYVSPPSYTCFRHLTNL